MKNNLRDLSNQTIKRLFEEQIKQLTLKTVSVDQKQANHNSNFFSRSQESHILSNHARVFDFQLSGGWI